MSKELEGLFNQWHRLNSDTSQMLGEWDFDALKEVRKEQRKIEDMIYDILLSNAPEELKKNLPEECGSLELGFNVSEKKFYFLMLDPEDDDSILAITIDVNSKVATIKNFKEDLD